MRKLQAASIVVVILVLFGHPSPARAKGPWGPIAVMTPDGQTFVLRGEDAAAFANDTRRLSCTAGCSSPTAAAKLAHRIESAVDPDAGPYLVSPLASVQDYGWSGALHFYPSTEHTRAFLMRPFGLIEGERLWNEWMAATPAMEDILLSGARSSQPREETSTAIGGDESTYRSLLIVPLLVVAGLGLGLAGLLYVRQKKVAPTSPSTHP